MIYHLNTLDLVRVRVRKRLTVNIKRNTGGHQSKSKVNKSKAEMQGTVQYMDSLNGTLVTNKWPPL